MEAYIDIHNTPQGRAASGAEKLGKVFIVLSAAIFLSSIFFLAPSADKVPKNASPQTPPPTPPPSDDSWRVTRSTSKMDDTPTILLSVRADAPIHGWPSQEYTPALMIRCKEHHIDLFVMTGMAPEPEYGKYDKASVRLRLDSAPPEDDFWDKSTDGKALLIDEPLMAEGLIERFLLAKVLTFQFTPFHSSPVITTFQLKGLSRHKDEIDVACPIDQNDQLYLGNGKRH